MSSVEAFAPEPGPAGLDAFLTMDQAVLEAIPVAVYVCAADGLLVRFNQRATELWGRTPRPGDTDERFCGSFRLYHPDGRPLSPSETPMGETLRTGVSAQDREIVIERPDGSRVAVLVNAQPIRSPAGRVQGAISCVQDITAKRNSESRVRDAEHRYRDLLEALPAAIYTTDAEGRITFYNRAAAELAGREPKLGIDQWCVTWRLYNDDGTPLPHDQCPMAQALKNKRPIYGQTAMAERPDGTLVPFSPYPSPIFDSDGKLAGAINMLVDLSEQRKADERQKAIALDNARLLREAQKEIEQRRNAEERLRLAMQAGKVGVWEWDITSNRVTWTDSLYLIHGIEKESFGGSVAAFSTLVHPDDRARVREAIERALNEDAPYELEFRAQKPDGQLIWLFTNAIVLKEYGKPVRMLGATLDITERKKADAQRDLLVAELSHRVKNTLATVVSIAKQSFAKGPSFEESRRSFNGRIRALAQTHTRLAEGNWSGVSLETEVLDELAPYQGDDGHNMHVSGPAIVLNPKTAVVLGMAIHELATNAAKYGSLSTKSGKVDVSWNLDGSNNELRICWQESGGPPVTPPQRDGFGRLLLERAVTSDLNGKVELNFAASGLRCEFVLPLEGTAAGRS